MSNMFFLLFFSLATAISNKPCPPFPPSMIPFSSSFQEPLPPLIQPSFNTSFIQHKWNQDLSHITAGYLVNSPSRKLVRAYEAFEGGMAASLFDYTNVTQDGLVDNTMTTYSHDDDGAAAKTEEWRGYVNSGFPLFEQDVLIKSGAVFGGLVRRRFVQDVVAAWSIMYQGAIPVTVYVDECGVMVGYDFFSPGERTKVITDYFNIKVAEYQEEAS